MTGFAAFLLTRWRRLGSALLSLALALLPATPATGQDLQDVNKLIKQGNHPQALDKLNTYLAGKPKDPLARFLKGVVLTEQGKTNEAISLFQALTEEYPELPEPYNNLAVLYAAKGQYEKAKVSLEMAIQTHPSYATAHENLGDIYAKMASVAYDKALQLDKSNKSAETKLSLIRDMFPNGKTSGTRSNSARVAAAAPPAKEPAPPAAVVAPVAQVATAPTVVAAPAHSAKPVPTPDESDAIIATIESWAKAWSNREVETYLSFYAIGYHPPGLTHDAWKAQRRERILAPKQISVSILSPKVTAIDATHARLNFRQAYRSDRLSTVSSKTLLLEKQSGQWRIEQEQSGK